MPCPRRAFKGDVLMENQMKRRFPERSHHTTLMRLVALAGVAIMAAACGSGATPTPIPEPIKLRYVTFAGLNAAEETLVHQFEADNPQITIEVEEYRQAPDQYFAGTPVPDLMLMTPGQMLDSAIDSGKLTDLSELRQDSAAEQAYLPNLRPLGAHEGRQYFLPVGYDWSGIYYNKQIFAQFGLQPPGTWDEFIQLCETLWLNGLTPLSVSGADPFMGTLWLDYLDLRLNGPEFHRQFSAGEVGYDDPRLRSVFELWASLVEKGYFVQTAGRMGIGDALAAVAPARAAGDAPVAMVLSGPAFMGGLAPEQRDLLGFFPFPTLDPSQPPAEVVMSIGYIVPAQAPQRDAALAFVRRLASAEGRALLVKDIVASGLYAPASATAEGEVLPERLRQGIELMQQADAVTIPYYMSVPTTLWPALSDMLRQIYVVPESGKSLDLDALLSKMEAARTK